MPRPRVILRLVGFAVAAGLALSGVQPIVAASTGGVAVRWAVELTAPAVTVAAVVFLAVVVSGRGGRREPPWYSAWLILPGAFLLAGAAAMCIFGALVQLALIAWTLWALLACGGLLWTGAMVLVRTNSH
jgi:hypothetical protein